MAVIDALLTSSGICMTEDKGGQNRNELRQTLKKKKKREYEKHKRTILMFNLCSHLIESKANGVHVLTLAPISAAVLLHERYQKTTRHLIVLWVIILLQQRDLVLRVDPKRVYTDGAFVLAS